MNTIHTFELCGSLTAAGYQLCRNHFFNTASKNHLPRCCYDDGAKLVFNYWGHCGVTVYLQKNRADQGFAAIYFRINPSVLLYTRTHCNFHRAFIDPDTLYAPESDLNKKIPVVFEDVLKELPIEVPLDSLALVRVDFCEDFIIPNAKTVTAYLRAIRKGMCHPKWADDQFGDERDEYSVRRRTKRYQVTIYDKTYQMANRFLYAEYNTESRKLRVEAALLTKGIYHMKKKYGVESGTWYDTLFSLLESGSWLLADVLSKVLPYGDYYTLAQAKRVIMASNFREDCKLALIDFLTEINRNTMVSMYQLKRVKSDKLRIQQLAYLGINIVTLDARKKIPFLPSLYSLMKGYGPYTTEKKVMYFSIDSST